MNTTFLGATPEQIALLESVANLMPEKWPFFVLPEIEVELLKIALPNVNSMIGFMMEFCESETYKKFIETIHFQQEKLASVGPVNYSFVLQDLEVFRPEVNLDFDFDESSRLDPNRRMIGFFNRSEDDLE